MGKIRMLSLDGGGVRGVITAYFISKLEKLTGKNANELFDYVTGTSVGGLNSAALFAPEGTPHYNASASNIVEMYENRGCDIFSESKWKYAERTCGVFESKYSRDGLDKIADEWFEGKTLNSTDLPVSMHSYSLTYDEAKTWSTFSACKNTEDNILLKDSVGATTAAPTYFDPKQITGTGDYHVDGGMYANNPVIAGYAEFKSHYTDYHAEDFIIVSFGTGEKEKPNYKVSEEDSMGLYEWVPKIIDVMFASVDASIEKEAEEMFGENYYRFQPIIPKKDFTLDDASEESIERLKEIAEDYYNKHKAEFEKVAKVLTQTEKTFHFDCGAEFVKDSYPMPEYIVCLDFTSEISTFGGEACFVNGSIDTWA